MAMSISSRGGRRLLKTNFLCHWSSALQQRLSSSCTWSANSLLRRQLLPTTTLTINSSKRFKFKRVGEERPLGTELNILGCSYKSDEWTNVPEKVINLIGTELYRRPGNPIFLIAETLRRHFSHHRVYHFPDPVVTLWANFDSILVPADHISRSRTDTFYVDAGHVLRGHTSAHQSECFQWCFNDNDNDNGKFLIIGDVYRRDEVNRTHHAAFHQCEAVQLYKEGNKEMSKAGISSIFDASQKATEAVQAGYSLAASRYVEAQLKASLETYIRRLFGNEANAKLETRWVEATFPFTHPSWELEMRTDGEGEWIEMLGCGVVHRDILTRTGQGDTIGWAFGCGLERLAMLYYAIPDIRLFWSKDTGFLHQFASLEPFQRVSYKPISTYPQKVFDISFWLPEGGNWSANDVHAIMLDIGGEMVEQAHLVEEWRRPSDGRTSNMYRIVYRSMDRPLTSAEVNVVHAQIEQALVQQLEVTIR